VEGEYREEKGCFIVEKVAGESPFWKVGVEKKELLKNPIPKGGGDAGEKGFPSFGKKGLRSRKKKDDCTVLKKKRTLKFGKKKKPQQKKGRGLGLAGVEKAKIQEGVLFVEGPEGKVETESLGGRNSKKESPLKEGENSPLAYKKEA